MKSAFLLITAACLASGQPAPPPAPAHGPAPALAPGVAGCCGTSAQWSGCCEDPCREGFLQKLRNRMGGLFQRRDACCDPCPAPCPAPAPVHHATTCCPTTTQHACDCGGRGHGLFGGGGGFGGRLRGLFQRRDECCDPCGSVYGGAYPGGVIAAPKPLPGEPIGPPAGGQPMPPGGEGEPPMGGTGTIAIPDAIDSHNLDIIPPAVVPNIPTTPGKSPF